MKSSNWSRTTVGEVCDIQLGKMLSPKSKTGLRSAPYLRNANVQWNRFDLADVSEMDFDDRERRKFALRPGDLLVCEGGEPGRSAVWEGQLDPCYYQKALHRLRPKLTDVEPRFLMFRLWLGAITGEFSESHAKTTIAHLPAVRLATLPLMLPPVQEQRAIAGELSAAFGEVERARMAAKVRLEAADGLAAAHLRRAFANSKLWRSRELGEVTRVIGGSTPDSSVAAFWNGDIVWITPTDLGRLSTPDIMSSDRRITQEGYESCGTEIVPSGSVVLSSRAPIGHLGIARTPLCTNQGCKTFVPLEGVDPEFLYFALKLAVPRFRELGSGATFAEVSKGTLESEKIRLPELSEQSAIARRLKKETSASASLRVTVESEITALAALPAALLRRAFRGEL